MEYDLALMDEDVTLSRKASREKKAAEVKTQVGPLQTLEIIKLLVRKSHMDFTEALGLIWAACLFGQTIAPW